MMCTDSNNPNTCGCTGGKYGDVAGMTLAECQDAVAKKKQKPTPSTTPTYKCKSGKCAMDITCALHPFGCQTEEDCNKSCKATLPPNGLSGGQSLIG